MPSSPSKSGIWSFGPHFSFSSTNLAIASLVTALKFSMFSSTILGRKIFGEILCRSLYHSWSFLKYIWVNRAKTWSLPGYWWFKRVESKLYSPSELDMFSFASSSSRSVPTFDKVLKRVGKIAKKIERRRFHFFLRPRNWLLVERNRAKYRQQMGMGVPSKESEQSLPPSQSYCLDQWSLKRRRKFKTRVENITRSRSNEFQGLSSNLRLKQKSSTGSGTKTTKK